MLGIDFAHYGWARFECHWNRCLDTMDWVLLIFLRGVTLGGSWDMHNVVRFVVGCQSLLIAIAPWVIAVVWFGLWPMAWISIEIMEFFFFGKIQNLPVSFGIMLGSTKIFQKYSIFSLSTKSLNISGNFSNFF